MEIVKISNNFYQTLLYTHDWDLFLAEWFKKTYLKN